MRGLIRGVTQVLRTRWAYLRGLNLKFEQAFVLVLQNNLGLLAMTHLVRRIRLKIGLNVV